MLELNRRCQPWQKMDAATESREAYSVVSDLMNTFYALLKTLDLLSGVGRFMLYEDQKKNDQIAGSAGQRGNS
ncbi:MAG: hypothetical protein ACYS8I_05715, partial [Planctomycetota bacterium]